MTVLYGVSVRFEKFTNGTLVAAHSSSGCYFGFVPCMQIALVRVSAWLIVLHICRSSSGPGHFGHLPVTVLSKEFVTSCSLTQESMALGIQPLIVFNYLALCIIVVTSPSTSDIRGYVLSLLRELAIRAERCDEI